MCVQLTLFVSYSALLTKSSAALAVYLNEARGKEGRIRRGGEGRPGGNKKGGTEEGKGVETKKGGKRESQRKTDSKRND